eukprot:CAMPEP_0184698676 /NCGR_PEP_ID=MMETSP0313-20130426/5205_1 /TAXON_ID=2792 /ORGANISM="Porphyridium aerugineum, Strain SAG 1380-2" /LENGTH=1313 /DNA_ID=CAMNT_0027157645 /DNA_START=203 /DNA_END=4144 /DNA_ORIENTATION=+
MGGWIKTLHKWCAWHSQSLQVGLQITLCLGIVTGIPVFLAASNTGCCNDWMVPCWGGTIAGVTALRLAPTTALGSRMAGVATVVSSVLIMVIYFVMLASVLGFIAGASHQSGKVFLILLSVIVPIGLVPIVMLRSAQSIARKTRVWGILSALFLGEMAFRFVRMLFPWNPYSGIKPLTPMYPAWSSMREYQETLWKVVGWNIANTCLGVACLAIMACLVFPQFSSTRIASKLDRFMLLGIASRFSRLSSILFTPAEPFGSDHHRDADHNSDTFGSNLSPTRSSETDFTVLSPKAFFKDTIFSKKSFSRMSIPQRAYSGWLESKRESTSSTMKLGILHKSTSMDDLHFLTEDSVLHHNQPGTWMMRRISSADEGLSVLRRRHLQEEMQDHPNTHEENLDQDTSVETNDEMIVSKADIDTDDPNTSQSGGNELFDDDFHAGMIGMIPKTKAGFLKSLQLPRESDGRSLLLDANVHCDFLPWEPDFVLPETSECVRRLVSSLNQLLFSLQTLQLTIDGLYGRRYTSATVKQILNPEAVELYISLCGMLVTHMLRARSACARISSSVPFIPPKSATTPVDSKQMREIFESKCSSLTCILRDEILAVSGNSQDHGNDSVWGGFEWAEQMKQANGFDDEAYISQFGKHQMHLADQLRRSLFSYFNHMVRSRAYHLVARAGELRAFYFAITMLHRLYINLEQVDVELNKLGQLQLDASIPPQDSSHPRLWAIWQRIKISSGFLMVFGRRILAVDVFLSLISLGTMEWSRVKKIQEQKKHTQSSGLGAAQSRNREKGENENENENEELDRKLSALGIRRVAGHRMKESRYLTRGVRYGIKVWLVLSCTFVSCLWIITVLPQYRVEWIYITVSIVFSARVESTWGASVNRILGTILGAVIGALVMSSKTIATSPYLVSLLNFIIMYIPCAFYYNIAISRQYAVLLFIITYQMVVFCQYNGETVGHISFAVERSIMVIIGSVIAMVVNRLLWPMYARDEIESSLSNALDASSDWFGAMYEAYFLKSRELYSRYQDSAKDTFWNATQRSSELSSDDGTLERSTALDEQQPELKKFESVPAATRQSSSKLISGMIDVEAWEHKIDINLDKIQTYLDAAQLVMLQELNVVSDEQLHIALSCYQLFVSLHALRWSMKRYPVVLNSHKGTDYMAYLSASREAMKTVFVKVGDLVYETQLAVHNSNLAKQSLLSVCFGNKEVDMEQKLALEFALTQLDDVRSQVREIFLRRRRELVIPLLEGHVDVEEYLSYWTPDDQLRFYTICYCWSLCLNKFALVGTTVAEDVIASDLRHDESIAQRMISLLYRDF